MNAPKPKPKAKPKHPIDQFMAAYGLEVMQVVLITGEMARAVVRRGQKHCAAFFRHDGSTPDQQREVLRAIALAASLDKYGQGHDRCLDGILDKDLAAKLHEACDEVPA